MAYKTHDRVPAILTKAPRRIGDRGYGFATPVSGGDAVYIRPDAMGLSGLTMADRGATVMLVMYADSPVNDPCAMHVERDDREIGGEEPDPIEAAILARLAKLERQLARMMLNERSREIEDV